MIKNYLKIAWRNALSNKRQSCINILSLSIGISCYMLIILWVKHERSIDNFHQNGESIFTVYQSVTAEGQTEASYASPYTAKNDKISFLLEGVEDAIPEVEALTFYTTGYELPWGHPETFQVGNKKMKLKGSRASANFFKVFSYPLLEGTVESALSNMTGIAISRKMAEIFYGSPKKAMGQSIRFEAQRDLIITGVFENLPENSSHQFDYLFNWDAQTNILEFASTNILAYLRLHEGANPQQVEKLLGRFLTARLDEKVGVKLDVGLQRFADQHLYNQFVNGKPTGGKIVYVRIFNGIAIFILLIACINFMNLATARSMNRAKEIGMRKVVGSGRSNLVVQFFGESILFAVFASLLSILLLIAALPLFNSLVETKLDVPFLHIDFWSTLLVISLVTGVIAGVYPSLYLSSLKTIPILKGVLKSNTGALLFRKGSIIFQFALSSLLLIATIVISRQLYFIHHANLGYDRENLVYVQVEGELSNYDKYKLFKQKLSGLPGIDLVDRSTEAPHEMSFEVTDPVNWQGKPENAAVGFKPASVGFDFVKLMKLELVDGRDFSSEMTTDSADAFLVNEQAVKQAGLENPIGKWISAWNKKGKIIGVLKDYHTGSMRDPVKPVVIDVKEYEYFGFILVRTKAGELTEALYSMEQVYNEINPNYPFTCQFVDQAYHNLYQSEVTTAKLSIIFALLAIVISCLGLLGLVIFSVEQRVREIGVRKILGSSVGEIVFLLSKDFLKLVAVALLLAVPLGYLLMGNWLNNFAYTIALDWWIFAIAGTTTVLVAMLTISYQAVQAAVSNPIKALREE